MLTSDKQKASGDNRNRSKNDDAVKYFNFAVQQI
jgi:hypothetical protein